MWNANHCLLHILSSRAGKIVQSFVFTKIFADYNYSMEDIFPHIIYKIWHLLGSLRDEPSLMSSIIGLAIVIILLNNQNVEVVLTIRYYLW